MILNDLESQKNFGDFFCNFQLLPQHTWGVNCDNRPRQSKISVIRESRYSFAVNLVDMNVAIQPDETIDVKNIHLQTKYIKTFFIHL